MQSAVVHSWEIDIKSYFLSLDRKSCKEGPNILFMQNMTFFLGTKFLSDKKWKNLEMHLGYDNFFSNWYLHWNLQASSTSMVFPWNRMALTVSNPARVYQVNRTMHGTQEIVTELEYKSVFRIFKVALIMYQVEMEYRT